MKSEAVKTTAKRLCAAVLALALLLSLAACKRYTATDADAALRSDALVSVSTVRGTVFFDGPGETDALIFYPGARVEETAYAPLLRTLASSGVDCFAVKMPFGYAFLGVNRAKKVMKRYDYERFFLAGHSLGGAMAARFAAKHRKTLDGLILLGAYSANNLTKAEFPVLYIYGTNDEILTRKKLDKGLQKSAEDTRVIELEGGNHANFGSYGKQKGDGKAKLSAKKQVSQTAGEILRLIEGSASVIENEELTVES